MILIVIFGCCKNANKEIIRGRMYSWWVHSSAVNGRSKARNGSNNEASIENREREEAFDYSDIFMDAVKL
jgi:hypothetical protein